MKALVTGATGFVGRHLLASLADASVEIRAMTRQTTPDFGGLAPTLEIIHADLTDPASLEHAFHGVDVVINLAAELRDKSKLEATNVQGVRNLVSFSLNAEVRKIIHVSSVAVAGVPYSFEPLSIDEGIHCRPVGGYERTKLESERLLMETFGRDPGRLIILRPTQLFGDLHPRGQLLDFLAAVKRRTRFVGTDGAVVNYLYVKDLVATIRYVMDHGMREVLYNVGHPTRFTEFLDVFASGLGVEPRHCILPEWPFILAEKADYLGSARLKAKLRFPSNQVGYSDLRLTKEVPRAYPFGLSHGVERTIAYFLSSGSL